MAANPRQPSAVSLSLWERKSLPLPGEAGAARTCRPNPPRFTTFRRNRRFVFRDCDPGVAPRNDVGVLTSFHRGCSSLAGWQRRRQKSSSCSKFAECDADVSALARVADGDLRAERKPELVLEGERVGVDLGRLLFGRAPSCRRSRRGARRRAPSGLRRRCGLPSRRDETTASSARAWPAEIFRRPAACGCARADW